ncbi:hypothetical protein SGLAM104S_04785 [Streptomyces glaucescens]
MAADPSESLESTAHRLAPPPLSGQDAAVSRTRQEARMTGTSTPAPFTADDYRARMERATRAAADAGLAGLLVAPGPDLVWLTGYAPTATTERLTLLVLAPGQDPVRAATLAGYGARPCLRGLWLARCDSVLRLAETLSGRPVAPLPLLRSQLRRTWEPILLERVTDLREDGADDTP